MKQYGQIDKVTLADLRPDQQGEIVKIETEDGVFKRRMQSLGVVSGAAVTLDRSAPLGDPRIYSLMGYSLGLRNAEARQIHIRICIK
ncbi:FeoA family protein [Magnetospirillum moscoviense]|uniref:FeoA family protein n=1 Tax=Magnetospirillum moscoviense TaxID=1437059 RepID=UPI000838376A|nr:FeoA family protein [Magnetospirillum moscoviense]MBF0327151.1 ferrous iron transport protein A [Alphaproteobacteria bacterium]